MKMAELLPLKVYLFTYSSHCFSAEEKETRSGHYALDSVVIVVTVFSMLLCSRSVVRAQLLRLVGKTSRLITSSCYFDLIILLHME